MLRRGQAPDASAADGRPGPSSAALLERNLRVAQRRNARASGRANAELMLCAGVASTLRKYSSAFAPVAELLVGLRDQAEHERIGQIALRQLVDRPLVVLREERDVSEQVRVERPLVLVAAPVEQGLRGRGMFLRRLACCRAAPRCAPARCASASPTAQPAPTAGRESSAPSRSRSCTTAPLSAGCPTRGRSARAHWRGPPPRRDRRPGRPRRRHAGSSAPLRLASTRTRTRRRARSARCSARRRSPA